MSEEKKEVEVRDLKPTNDAKGGGRRGRSQSGGRGHRGNDLNTAGRGRHYPQ